LLNRGEKQKAMVLRIGETDSVADRKYSAHACIELVLAGDRWLGDIRIDAQQPGCRLSDKKRRIPDEDAAAAGAVDSENKQAPRRIECDTGWLGEGVREASWFAAGGL